MNFSELKKIGDINYFNSPYLSLFVNSKGELFLCNWVKMLSNSHLWLVLKTDCERVLNYMDKKLDYVSFLKDSLDKNYYLVEIGANVRILNTRKVSDSIFLDSSLPSKPNLFFDEDFCDDYDKIVNFLKLHLHIKPQKRWRFSQNRPQSFKSKFLFNSNATNSYAKQPKYI